MAERASPLAAGKPAHGLSQRPLAGLWQYHAWPERYAEMAPMLAAHCGAAVAPAPGKAIEGQHGTLLRVHPQRLWLVAERAGPAPDADVGVVLDLSHARTVIHVADAVAEPLLSRFIAIDLRPDKFKPNHLALTPLHRVGVLLWRRDDGIDILAPRSFARSIWDLLAETAERLV